MVSIQSNSSKPTKTLKHKIHSRRILSSPKNTRQIQAQNPQCTQDYQVPQNPQPTQTQSFAVLDRYAEQIHLRREWEEKMERLNEMYGIDYFSDSELDSELDEGQNY